MHDTLIINIVRYKQFQNIFSINVLAKSGNSKHFFSFCLPSNLYYQKSNQYNDFQTMVYTICLGFFFRQPQEPKAFLRQQKSLCGLSD